MITVSYPGNSLSLKVNPHEISFDYSLNTAEFDTAAGKVVQILSTNIGDMTVSSRIGASKGHQREAYNRYFNMVRFCRDMMLWQAEHNTPGTFVFPYLNYNLKVFLKGQTFTDDFENISYPYSLTFAVDQDISGVVEDNALKSVLGKVKKGVGFTAGKAGWHGGQI